MAAVQTMTLGHQDNGRMYSLVHHPDASCVIVSSTNLPQPSSVKTVIHQGKRPLAPAPERNNNPPTSVLVTNNKRKIQFVPYSGVPQQSASVARRNARERNRVKQVNNGFATLRQHIPVSVVTALTSQNSHGNAGRGAHKKLSKVETLRLAVEYIRSLKQMLDESENDNPTTGAHASGVVVPPANDNNVLQDNRLFAGSPDSGNNQQFNPYITLLPTPPSSVASASPTPSHTSDGSAASAYMQTNVYKHETAFDNFDTKSPEDDELLDAIFYWQESE